MRRTDWPRNLKIICHSWYGKEQLSTQCTLKLHQLELVVDNYKGLSTDDKTKVPDASYKNTKVYLAVIKNTDNMESKYTSSGVC